MERAVATVDPDATLQDASEKLEAGKFKHLCVVEASGRLVGILNERDVNKALSPLWRHSARKGVYAGLLGAARVRRFMTEGQLFTESTALLADAAARMLDGGIEALAVIDSGEVVGLLSKASCRDS
jgi:CBS domain-containing protein